jgi:hypothetical protein
MDLTATLCQCLKERTRRPLAILMGGQDARAPYERPIQSRMERGRPVRL